MTKYWLMKSEPDTFSIDDLMKLKVSAWDGVRNYQARNFLRVMRCGDLAFFYHSSCKVPGIVGIVEVVKEAYIDITSAPSIIWSAVDVRYVSKFAHILSLEELKKEPKLHDCILLRPGNRLSVFPVSAEHFNLILRLQDAQK